MLVMVQDKRMFALSGGEIAIVAFIFALVWGAGVLPRLGERLGERYAGRRRVATDQDADGIRRR
jgi:Sec-independent protein translocase protein TatA